MSWKKIADLVLRTSIKAFSTPAVFTRADMPGAPIALFCVFDTAHQSVDPQTGVPIDTTQPTAGIRLLDLGTYLNGARYEPGDGDSIIIEGIMYRILLSTEDGQGGSTLQLGKIS